MRRNARRRELVEPVFVPGSFELTFLDRDVQDKTGDSINQSGNDSHLGNSRRTAKGSDRRFAKNGYIFFERAVSSLGSRSQSVQLPIPFRTSRDFQNKTRMLGYRDMSGIAEPIGSMGTVAVELDIGRKIGFHALFETGERKPLSGRIEAVRSRGEMAIWNIRPTISIVASLKERFTNQFFIPGIVIN